MTEAPVLDAAKTLDREFLNIRANLLVIAAALDRIDAGGRPATDLRLAQVRRALGVLAETEPDRAQRVQMVFSDAYEAGWPRPTPAARH
jgi:hypothetical protein